MSSIKKLSSLIVLFVLISNLSACLSTVNTNIVETPVSTSIEATPVPTLTLSDKPKMTITALTTDSDLLSLFDCYIPCVNQISKVDFSNKSNSKFEISYEKALIT